MWNSQEYTTLSLHIKKNAFWGKFVSMSLIVTCSSNSNKSTNHVHQSLRFIACRLNTVVFKRQAINLRDWYIWLVDLFEYVMMHGLTNPKCNNKFRVTYVTRFLCKIFHLNYADLYLNVCTNNHQVLEYHVMLGFFFQTESGKTIENMWIMLLYLALRETNGEWKNSSLHP
jgi:hypothetical protein